MLTGDGELQEGQFWESLGVGGESRAGRDHRDRGPQQDPVRHLGARVSDLGDLEAKFRAFGWHVSAATATTSRPRADVPRARCASPTGRRSSSPTPSRAGGVSFMGPGAEGRAAVRLHSGAPANRNYAAGLDELMRRGQPAVRRARPGRDPHRALVRNPGATAADRNWCRLRARAASSRARRHPQLIGARRRPDPGLGLSPFASGSRTGSSSAGSPSRTWCRWPAAWRAAERCRWCIRSPASWRPGPTSRSTTSAASTPRSSTSARWRGCCRRSRPLAPVGARHLGAGRRARPA